MPITDDDGLRRLLGYERVAVVGCSTTPGKAAHDVPRYLLDHGYDVTPVNPYADEIFGRRAYDSVSDVESEIDLVDVFRPSDEVSGIVDEVIARAESRGDVRAVWTQLGIRDDEAAKRAEAVGLDVVQDACMKVEHARLVD
jgi:hypothetical protein